MILGRIWSILRRKKKPYTWRSATEKSLMKNPFIRPAWELRHAQHNYTNILEAYHDYHTQRGQRIIHPVYETFSDFLMGLPMSSEETEEDKLKFQEYRNLAYVMARSGTTGD